MKRTAIRSAIKIICFLVILVLAFGIWNHVFKVKYGDGIYDVTKFYELDRNTVDVLFLGSSHAFEDFNTGVLWDEYGMSSFVLAGSIQPLWNTYYYLKEALKTQRPKLIVLEGYCTVFSSEYIDDSRIIKNNYGLHWSMDKIESLRVSAPEDRWTEFFLEYSQYHTRYKELSRADFFPNQGNPLFVDWKGFGCNMVTTPLESIDVRGITDNADMFPKQEKYYRAILDLAIEEGIPIMVVISPYAGISEGEQRIFNRAKEIATEKGVPFINYNLLIDEIGIDYSTDASDGSHLNYRGNQKFTKYFGNFLSEQYDIPDHRGDKKYQTWERDANYIRQMIYNQELKEITELPALCEKVRNPNYWIFVSVDGTCPENDDTVIAHLCNLGIASNGSGGYRRHSRRQRHYGGIWQIASGSVSWVSSNNANELYIRTLPHDFYITRSEKEGGGFENKIVVDKTPYKKVTNGINVLVYDPVTEEIVICFGINSDDGYSLAK